MNKFIRDVYLARVMEIPEFSEIGYFYVFVYIISLRDDVVTQTFVVDVMGKSCAVHP